MNKKVFIVLGVVLVLGAVALFAFGDDDALEEGAQEGLENGATEENEMAAGEDEAEEVVVTYTADGFSPETVMVASGSTVVFVNESSAGMHVASDPHPAHTDLPEFDQLRSGDSYEFIFTEEGTWGYHNHVAPHHTGTVVVE